jgi:hypothetical protein
MTDVQNEGGAAHINDKPWRAEVLARVAVLEASAESVCPATGGSGRNERVCARIRQLLKDTKDQAQAKRRLRDRLKDFRNGGPIERAWRNLHSAEVLLAEVVGMGELSSQRPAVRSMAKRVLPATDARTQAIEHSLSDKVWAKLPTRRDSARAEKLRHEYVASLTWVHDACDKNFTRVRSFRNVVLAASVGLAVIAIGLGVIGMVSPSSLPLCFDPSARSVENVVGAGTSDGQVVCPTGVHSGPTGGDVPLVLAIGFAAGAFAAALAVRNMRGTSTPYCVPVAIAWLKLPAGALTALFAMLMLRGGFIPGLSALDNQGQIIAYAMVFGYAQQIFTRLVDNQAQAVLDRSPSSEPDGAAVPAGPVDTGGRLAGADVS